MSRPPALYRPLSYKSALRKSFIRRVSSLDCPVWSVPMMMPGGRMNPKQMQAMMRRMGIAQEEVPDVVEVVIRTKTKELVFKDAVVTSITAQGQKTYQVIGMPQERAPRAETGAEPAQREGGIPEEDVKLVMAQTGCTASEARKALEESEGAPAEAILKIMSSR